MKEIRLAPNSETEESAERVVLSKIPDKAGGQTSSHFSGMSRTRNGCGRVMVEVGACSLREEKA